MKEFASKTMMSRRGALALGGRAAGGILAVASLGLSAETAACASGLVSASRLEKLDDTLQDIEEIIQAEGMVDNGVFTIEIDREDITNVTLHGVPILPSFEINGTLYFQKLSHDVFYLNGDFALKDNEVDPFIDQLLKHNIVFQAEHQHFYDFEPPVWFIHYRKVGEPERLARAIKAAIDVTSTPFPQTMPSNPTTPLPADKLGQILGGSVSIGSDGVVTVDVPREDPIILGGIRINPFLGVQTTIAFEPLDNTGKTAAAAPDFGMVASEIQSVTAVMRAQGWDIGCLYNQEIDEHPQLFFSHQFKAGDPITLAHEIRRGLNRMDMKFTS